MHHYAMQHPNELRANSDRALRVLREALNNGELSESTAQIYLSTLRRICPPTPALAAQLHLARRFTLLAPVTATRELPLPTLEESREFHREVATRILDLRCGGYVSPSYADLLYSTAAHLGRWGVAERAYFRALRATFTDRANGGTSA